MFAIDECRPVKSIGDIGVDVETRELLFIFSFVLDLTALVIVRLLQTAMRFAHSNDARYAFRLVRAMHSRPARGCTHGRAKSQARRCPAAALCEASRKNHALDEM